MKKKLMLMILLGGLLMATLLRVYGRGAGRAQDDQHYRPSLYL